MLGRLYKHKALYERLHRCLHEHLRKRLHKYTIKPSTTPLQINQTKRSIKLYGSIRGIEGVSPLEVYIELLSRSILATQYEGFKGVSL